MRISQTKKIIESILLLFFVFTNIDCFGQNDLNVDLKWRNYYLENPSQLKESHQASDFLRIADLVGFVPTSNNLKKDIGAFKRAFLDLSQAALNQMYMDGAYYSESYKHDDYFYLYNITYVKISKLTWDKYCPYLIPMMKIDQTITLE